ncbi:MAG: MBL fold metallo-hydrolase RNA specificity domain-containing protein [Desulfitobacteriia bacterium]|jgi:metallo-beta-lactamase family protein
MKIFFYGASQTVTGSCYLVETLGFKLLIDCGMFQGNKVIKELNYGEFPFEPGSIDAVILTHAHIDHSGLIPKLVKKGYQGPIYSTKATMDLCSIMLPDSGHIQEMEIERKNRKRTRAGLPLLEAIYTAQDGYNAIQSFVPVDYGKNFAISERIAAEFFDAGHILGSSHVVLTITEGEETKRLVFSGDIGSTNQPFIEDPSLIEHADLIIMETTYGNRHHIDKSNRLELLAEVINNAYAQGGNVIIPAFAIERTQDLLYYLHKLQSEQRIPEMPIYIDSPLAIEATRIFQKNIQHFDEESTALIEEGNNPLTMKNLKFSETTQDSINLNTIPGGTIIISASGMADAGRIKHHLKHNLWRPNATVVFVGYQAEGTLGRRLIDGAKEVTIHGECIHVNATIANLPGFSGHADQSELYAWLKTSGKTAEQIILVHGEEQAIHDFADLVEERLGKKSLIPVLGEEIEFKGQEVIRIKPARPWLDVLQEKYDLQKAMECAKLPKGSKYTGQKVTQRRKILLSEVNHSYGKLRKNLRTFVDTARKERDYTHIIETLEKISKLLEESKNKYLGA